MCKVKFLGLNWAVLLLGFIALPLHAADAAAPETPKIAVQFTLKGMITEQSEENDFLQALMGQEAQVGVREILRRLEAAASSDKVACVLLAIDDPHLSWDHALDLSAGLAKIKKAGKTVIAHAENLGAMEHLLAGAANKIYVSPGGMVLLKGLFARQLFLKGSLDKLGLQADLYQIGDYKGAAEPLTLTAPSKESKEMFNWLMDDWYALLAENVGQARNKNQAAGEAWLTAGPYTASQAASAGLIDGVKSRLDAQNEIKQLAGLREVDKLDAKFAEKKREALDLSNPFGFFKIFSTLFGAQPAEATAKPVLGLVYALGTIVSGRDSDDGQTSVAHSASLVAALEKARTDASVKAVVLRINSPGGSAQASEDIHSALVRLNKEKPLVVSMGAMAASGGYYIAAPAERIFAQPSTLTGSIGVVGGKLVFKGLADWLGVTSYVYSRGGPKAGIFDTMAPFNPEEQAWFRSSMQEVYDLFTKAVKEGRGSRLKDFAKVAGGRVFTGRQALKNGLIDELGSLEDAQTYAAGKAGLQAGGYQVKVLNPPLSFAQRLLKSLSGETDENAFSSAPLKSLQALVGAQNLLALLREVSPAQAALFARQFILLDLLQQHNPVMMQPFEIEMQP